MKFKNPLAGDDDDDEGNGDEVRFKNPLEDGAMFDAEKAPDGNFDDESVAASASTQATYVPVSAYAAHTLGARRACP